VKRQPTHKPNTKNILTKKKSMQSQRQSQRKTEMMDDKLAFVIDSLLARNHGEAKNQQKRRSALIIDSLLERNHDKVKNQQKRRSRQMRRDTISTMSTGTFPSSNNIRMPMDTSGNSGIPRVIYFPTNEATAAPREYCRFFKKPSFLYPSR
jgi:hypothetical protein